MLSTGAAAENGQYCADISSAEDMETSFMNKETAYVTQIDTGMSRAHKYARHQTP